MHAPAPCMLQAGSSFIQRAYMHTYSAHTSSVQAQQLTASVLMQGCGAAWLTAPFLDDFLSMLFHFSFHLNITNSAEMYFLTQTRRAVEPLGQQHALPEGRLALVTGDQRACHHASLHHHQVRMEHQTNARFGFHFSCRLDVIKLDTLLETNVPAITQANITIQFRMNHLKMLSMMWLLF